MKHTFELNKKKYLAIQVPPDAISFKETNYPVSGKYFVETSSKELNAFKVAVDSRSKYNMIGIYPKDFTEEMCENIVDKEDIYFVNYKGSHRYGTISVFKTALESFASKMEVEKLYLTNPYLHLGSEKPKGDVLISYDKGETFDDSVEWTDKRTCMMAGIAGGHGYFKEGWATSHNSQTDTGLICDPPDFWIHADEEEEYIKAKSRTSSQYLILQVNR